MRGPGGPRRGADLKNLGLIQDGAVLIVDGLIQEVGPTRRLENLAVARAAEEIDASGCVVMPGFVDSQMHAVSGPARLAEHEMRLASGRDQEIARYGNGALAIAKSIQDHTPRALEALARGVMERAVRHGTTSFGAESGLGLTTAGEVKILRVHAALQRHSNLLVSTFVSARVSPDYEARPEEYLDRVCARLLPMLKRRKLAEFAGIRCGEASFTLTEACRYLIAARQLGFRLKLDAGESAGHGAVALAVQVGASSVVPGTDTPEQEAKLLGESQTVAALLPGPVFHNGRPRYPDARLLIANGAAVALATGYNPETSPSQSMQMMIALACRFMNLTPAEAIVAATINAAHALRRADIVGSLETGKSADLIVLGVPDYREVPYHFGVNLVDLVMKSGAVLVKRAEVQWPAS